MHTKAANVCSTNQQFKQLKYQSLIQPHFNYYNIVGESVGELCRIARMRYIKSQNRGTRVSTYYNFDADAGHCNTCLSWAVFELLRWANLQQQIQKAIMGYEVRAHPSCQLSAASCSIWLKLKWWNEALSCSFPLPWNISVSSNSKRKKRLKSGFPAMLNETH